MEYIPSVVQAIPGDNHTVFAYFSDGSIHRVDVSPLIARGGVFSQLNDEKLFRDALTVLNDTVAWDISGNRDETTCIDLDPWNIYENSPVVADPLEFVA